MTKRYQKGKRRESLSMYSSSHKYQPLLYRRQTALSAAGSQLALTSIAQMLHWETLSSLDQNSLYVVQSYKGTLVRAQHTLQSTQQVWEQFSPWLIWRNGILFLLPFDFPMLIALMYLSEGRQALLQVQHIPRGYLIQAIFKCHSEGFL